jgi:hypothetical protein
VTTLDALVAEHGEPAFCKIDVEGFELDVLRGLSRPVRALSFEYLPPAHDAALAALDLVDGLGDYAYNYSPVETLRFASDALARRRRPARGARPPPPARPVGGRVRASPLTVRTAS